MPNEGPQTDFLAAAEKDVLYGGAAGGGKSFAMLIDPLRYCHIKEHRALILRRSMPELRELIDKSRELYPKAFKGAKFREVEKLWNFPSGAKIEFGFLEKDADVYRYQGQAYSWIGFDEITHLPTEFGWNYTLFVFCLFFSLIDFVKFTRVLIGFKKYLFKTNEKINITIPTAIAVLITKVFLSSMAAFISLAFSVIAKYPIFLSSFITFLIVVSLKLLNFHRINKIYYFVIKVK